MRAFLAALTLLALLPAVQAADDPAGITIHPDVTLPSGDCGDCIGVALDVYQSQPPGCADCATIGAHVAAEHEGRETTVEATVCRGGFVVICVVDESITI